MRNPASSEDNGIVSFREQIDFVSHVADSYPDLTADFPHQLIELLTQHHEHLEAELCEKVVSSLVLLRNRHIIESVLYVLATSPVL